MTPETRKTLLDLISEYGNSLTRIQGEKEHRRVNGSEVSSCPMDRRHD